MSIPVAEIVTVIKLGKELVEWFQEQKNLGNITQEQFDDIFENIEVKKSKWDSLGPNSNE